MFEWDYKLEAETMRRYIRHYIARGRAGESRMNLTWEAKPIWKQYRYSWRMALRAA